MKKKIGLLVIVLMMLVTIVACSNAPVEEQKPLEEEKTEQQDPVKEETNQENNITVIDHLGRTVTISKYPEKIVSGYYISTSALIALGLEDKLIGVEAKAEKRPLYKLAAPKLLDLPNVGTAKEFDLEKCISLEPDLVIVPIKLKDQIKILEDLGIKVIGVNPENKESLGEMITMIATLTGVEDYNKILIYYEDKEKEMEEIYANSGKEKPTVYLAGNSDMLSTASSKMYQNSLIEGAGGINVAHDIEDTYWAKISYEQLLKYNPEYIIIVSEASYTKEDVMNDVNLAGIKAIKNNNVYKMPNNYEAWDSPVPSSILGKMWLTSVLYSDDYLFDDYKEDAYNFYKDFYDIKIEKEDLSINE